MSHNKSKEIKISKASENQNYDQGQDHYIKPDSGMSLDQNAQISSIKESKNTSPNPNPSSININPTIPNFPSHSKLNILI